MSPPAAAAAADAGAAAGDPAAAVQMRQSPSDHKSYRYFRLPQGLSVLCIHDPAIAEALAQEEAGSDADAGANRGGSAQPDGGGAGAPADASMSGDESGSSGSEDDEDEDGDEGSSGTEDGSSEDDGSEAPRGKGGQQLGGSKKAAAAMAVGVGSFSDPGDMQGLSHFLEHMLFMGSDKFPDENEYDSFLSKHGGSSNAFTELEYTNYHFEVAPASLEGALDRFAQFFVAPLFQAGALEREVQAVDSEFKGVLQSDHSRLAQLMCHTCRPGHIYNKFSWGNLLSLWEQPREAGLDVRQRIIEYYKTQYGAERMSLVVLGGQSLDQLQAWVERLFAAVPRGGVGPPPDFAGAGAPFEGRCLYVAPAVKEHHEVTVTFQLPCLRGRYRDKPEHYISHLVGHEGPGSLLSALKARGWALELCAGVDDDGYSANTAAYLFTVNIVLTETGLQAGPGFGLAPVALLFQYLKLIRETGPQEWVWEELRAISNMKFRFMEEEDGCDLVTRLASTMGWVAPEDLLVADFLHESWQPDLVMQLLENHMQPTGSSSSFRIDLLTKSFSALKQQLLGGAGPGSAPGPGAAAGSVRTLTEPWFGIEGVRWQLPDSLTQGWATADVSGELALPPRNPFIPTDFALKGSSGGHAGDADATLQQQDGEAAAAAVPRWMLAGGGRPDSISVLLSSPPAMIVDEPGIRLWHKLATSYRQPRMLTFFRLSSPVAAATPTACVLCALWLRLVEETRAEDAYLAEVAGLHWSSSPEGVAGLEVRADGFSDKLHVLVQRVFDCLARCELKAAAFPAVREELLRRYRNALLKPGHAANALRLQLLAGGPSWTHDQLADALAAVTDVAQVKAFAAQFLARCHLESLIMGNVTAAEAQSLCRSVAASLDAAGAGGLRLPAAERPQECCVQLPDTVSLLHRAAARNPEEDNCCVEVYYQVGLSSGDLMLRVLADVVEQLLYEPLYDSLRTKQQLGYTVSSGTRLTHGATGFCVVVVSAAFDAGTVEARVEEFLQAYQDGTLASMTEAEFARHKAALTSNKLQRDTTLGQEGDRAWEQVFSTRYEFVCKEQEAAVLQRVTLADVQAFFAAHLAPGSRQRRKACVHVIPAPRCDGGGTNGQRSAAPSEGPQHVHHGLSTAQAHHAHQAAAAAPGADESHAPLAADADGGAASSGSGVRQAKRAKRPQQLHDGGAVAAGACGLQVLPVQFVGDVEAVKSSLQRLGVYHTVVPQLGPATDTA